MYQFLRAEIPYMKSHMMPYALVNVGCFVLDMGLVLLLTTTTTINYLLVVIGSFLFTSLILFILSRYYVFPGTQKCVRKSFIVFWAVVAVKAVIAVAFIFILVEYAHLGPVLARLLSGSVEAVLAFLFDYILTFSMHTARVNVVKVTQKAAVPLRAQSELP